MLSLSLFLGLCSSISCIYIITGNRLCCITIQIVSQFPHEMSSSLFRSHIHARMSHRPSTFWFDRRRVVVIHPTLIAKTRYTDCRVTLVRNHAWIDLMRDKWLIDTFWVVKQFTSRAFARVETIYGPMNVVIQLISVTVFYGESCCVGPILD